MMLVYYLINLRVLDLEESADLFFECFFECFFDGFFDATGALTGSTCTGAGASTTTTAPSLLPEHPMFG